MKHPKPPGKPNQKSMNGSSTNASTTTTTTAEIKIEQLDNHIDSNDSSEFAPANDDVEMKEDDSTNDAKLEGETDQIKQEEREQQKNMNTENSVDEKDSEDQNVYNDLIQFYNIVSCMTSL